MAGKAYNPKGFEPDAHENFDAPPPEVVEAYRKANQARRARAQHVSYEEIQEARKKRESRAIGHYAYEMQFDVYRGIEDELIEGAFDTHLHIYPDYVPRSNDIIELAIECSRDKMRGIVCKDHFFTNVGQAWAAEWVCNEMVKKGELGQACHVFGTHILAWSHHPDQIHLVRKYPNLGAIFFYTMTGGAQAGPELKIVDGNGKLMPDVKECIRLCAEYKIPIMTGHKSYNLVVPMVEYAAEVGAHILVTHAGTTTSSYQGAAGTIEQARELAKLGAYLEVNGNKVLPNLIIPMVDPNILLGWIETMGPNNIIANSDHGQPFCGDAHEQFKLFVRAMMHYGIDKQAIKRMIQTNPAKFLYLDD